MPSTYTARSYIHEYLDDMIGAYVRKTWRDEVQCMVDLQEFLSNLEDNEPEDLPNFIYTYIINVPDISILNQYLNENTFVKVYLHKDNAKKIENINLITQLLNLIDAREQFISKLETIYTEVYNEYEDSMHSLESV